MLFCIDVGNTNTVLGLADKGNIVKNWRIRTEREITPDELGVLVANLFRTEGIKMKEVTGSVISCVVPPLLNNAEEFCRKYFGLRPMVVGPGLKIGMPIKYGNPKEVGADRIVNAVAAFENYHSALVVVDFGTATTFDYISSDGAYMGGAIAPGVFISCEALFQHASKLPRVEIFAKPKSVIARDTVSSMNVGIVYGYAGLVDGIVKRMKRESGEDAVVIATGGLAPLMSDVCETIDYVEELLALQGLVIIYERNTR